MAPAIPLMNTKGTKTAMVVKVELSIGVITSVVPRSHASSNVHPLARCWAMFSVTMMELSIIIPKAKMRPDIEMMLSDMPNR